MYVYDKYQNLMSWLIYLEHSKEDETIIFFAVRPCFHHISFEFDLKFIKILFLTLCKLRNFTYFLSSGDSPPPPPPNIHFSEKFF